MTNENEYISSGGVTLQLKCNWASGVKTLTFHRDTTLKECADMCANETKCVELIGGVLLGCVI